MNNKLIKHALLDYDYAIILPYSTINNLNKNEKHDNETIQASPKWGKKGVGAVIPLAFY